MAPGVWLGGSPGWARARLVAHQASWLGLGSGALARLRFGSALLRLSAGFRLDFGCIFASGFQLLGFGLDFILTGIVSRI